MGFDPMTHQPRTDLFCSLPHLLALANLGDLMEHHPFDENAVRLQAEAVHLLKLQYLQYLLQSAASTTANNITDRDTINLLNSNPVLNSLQAENPAPYSLGNIATSTTQPLHHPSLLSHPSDPQVPFNFQTSFNSTQGDLHNPPDDSSWVFPFPMIEETSISNLGDATSTSTSSYGGGASSGWPELFFDDHIMHEILS